MSNTKNNFPVLSIIGTTSVGKTAFALALADLLISQEKHEAVHIISADSRQVYKGLEILSGADVPSGFEKKNNFYVKNSVFLHGISIIEPTEEWSVGQFQQFAQEIIEKAKAENHAVLIVGGTGLYHRHLTTIDPILQVSPNAELRAELENFTVEELQQRLAETNPDKLAQMNNSDRNNPRRLVRAIEVASATPQSHSQNEPNISHHSIALTSPLESIIPKIEKRVIDRLHSGAAEEVQKLIDQHANSLSHQVTTTLGFAELQAFLEGELSEQQTIERWTLSEKQYAQRQLTWWKKEPKLNWFSIENTDWQTQALTLGQKLLTP